ncbi:MAG: RagB/SusD family nutrient uptake outer membrane protein [Parabacteroides sp.]
MKFRHITIIAVLFASFTSCEVTDTVPQDAITDLNYWTKADDIKLFANRFYSTLSGPSNNLDNTSDNIVEKTPNDRLFNNLTTPGSGGGWSISDWNNIRNLNYALTHSETVEGSETDINQYLGEIHFFRANEYFNKVKRFGDVPWIDKDLTITDDDFLQKARDPRKFVVDKIIEDLEFAVDNMKNPSDVESGRLHKFAALQMLSRVCLYEGTWMKYRNISGWETLLQKAAASAERIMTEGNYDIVKGNASIMFDGFPLFYRQQFIQEDLTDNKECVLARIYKKDLLMHGLSRSVFESGYGVSKDFIEDFLCVDGEPIALSPLYLGDDSLQMEMTNRDPRLRNMIDNKKLPWYLDGSKPISSEVTAIALNSCPTGYQWMKFRDPTPAQNEANQTTFDWYIFRYAEVLLNFAEAKAELGTLTQLDLDNSINKLRSRLDEPGKFTMGRMNLNPPTDPLSIVNGNPRYGYTISAQIYEIRRERRIELAFEGFRWDDICRWNAGKLIENIKTMLGMTVNDEVIKRYEKFYSGTNPFDGRPLYEFTDWDGTQKKLLKIYTNSIRKWNDRLYLSPLPTDQMTLNPNLEQNPGWEK